jgi:uncharacterized membrane protein YfcA
VVILYIISGVLGLAAFVAVISDEIRALIFGAALLIAIVTAFFASKGIWKNTVQLGMGSGRPHSEDAIEEDAHEPAPDGREPPGPDSEEP